MCIFCVYSIVFIAKRLIEVPHWKFTNHIYTFTSTFILILPLQTILLLHLYCVSLKLPSASVHLFYFPLCNCCQSCQSFTVYFLTKKYNYTSIISKIFFNFHSHLLDAKCVLLLPATCIVVIMLVHDLM